MQSLADALGTAQPRKEQEPSLLDAKAATAEEFAERFLASYEFRKYLVDLLTLGELPAAIILRLMDYARGWGKPATSVRLEVHDSPLSELSASDLKARAAYLLSVADELEAQDAFETDPSTHDLVH